MARIMICLDINYLILGLVPGSQESRYLIAWSQAGEALITPMSAWYEFICGPVTAPQIAALRAFLHDLVPFDEQRLPDHKGRSRDRTVIGQRETRTHPLRHRYVYSAVWNDRCDRFRRQARRRDTLLQASSANTPPNRPPAWASGTITRTCPSPADTPRLET